jgi:hypothetical protein
VVSAAELFRWPITKWTHACGNFIASTVGSPKFCATCSYRRHVHKRKEKNVTYSIGYAMWKLQMATFLRELGRALTVTGGR